jgi:hypothetical protein
MLARSHSVPETTQNSSTRSGTVSAAAIVEAPVIRKTLSRKHRDPDYHGAIKARLRPPQILWNVAVRHEKFFHAILDDRHKLFCERGQCPFLRAAGEQRVFGEGVVRATAAFTDEEVREGSVEAFAIGFARCKFRLLPRRLGLNRRGGERATGRKCGNKQSFHPATDGVLAGPAPRTGVPELGIGGSNEGRMIDPRRDYRSAGQFRKL